MLKESRCFLVQDLVTALPLANGHGNITSHFGESSVYISRSSSALWLLWRMLRPALAPARSPPLASAPPPAAHIMYSIAKRTLGPNTQPLGCNVNLKVTHLFCSHYLPGSPFVDRWLMCHVTCNHNVNKPKQVLNNWSRWGCATGSTSHSLLGGTNEVLGIWQRRQREVRRASHLARCCAMSCSSPRPLWLSRRIVGVITQCTVFDHYYLVTRSTLLEILLFHI